MAMTIVDQAAQLFLCVLSLEGKDLLVQSRVLG